MKKSDQLPTEEGLRRGSRELLRVYKFLFDRPKNSLVTTVQIGNELGQSGRALGGILAGSQKVAYTPIIVPQGTIKSSWGGKDEKRQQLWSINPRLPKEKLREIKRILVEMFLDVFRIKCPKCNNNTGAERIHRGVGASGEGTSLPANVYRCTACDYVFSSNEHGKVRNKEKTN